MMTPFCLRNFVFEKTICGTTHKTGCRVLRHLYAAHPAGTRSSTWSSKSCRRRGFSSRTVLHWFHGIIGMRREDFFQRDPQAASLRSHLERTTGMASSTCRIARCGRSCGATWSASRLRASYLVLAFGTRAMVRPISGSNERSGGL